MTRVVCQIHTQTHTWVSRHQKWFYWSKRRWVAVASAGPYASPHLALRLPELLLSLFKHQQKTNLFQHDRAGCSCVSRTYVPSFSTVATKIFPTQFNSLHTSTSTLSFLHTGCPLCCQINSIKALKAPRVWVSWCLTYLFSTNIWLYQGRKVRGGELSLPSIGRPAYHRQRSSAALL